jgi:hypothetical protein
VFCEPQRKVPEGHHALLVADRARPGEARQIHSFRMIEPVLFETFAGAAAVAGSRRAVEGRFAEILGEAQGIVADQRQQSTHRLGPACTFEAEFGGDAVLHVGELVELGGEHLDQRHLDVGRGPPAALRETRGQGFEHEQTETVVVAQIPVEIVADRRQHRRQFDPAAGAVRAAGGVLELNRGIERHQWLPPLSTSSSRWPMAARV